MKGHMREEAAQDLLVLGVTGDTWEQVHLPILTHVVQPAARVAALTNFQMNGTTPHGKCFCARHLAPTQPYPPRNLTRLQAQLGPHRDPLAEWIEVAATLASATTDPATQRWWAKHVFESLFGRQQCQWICVGPHKVRLPKGAHRDRLAVRLGQQGIAGTHSGLPAVVAGG